MLYEQFPDHEANDPQALNSKEATQSAYSTMQNVPSPQFRNQQSTDAAVKVNQLQEFSSAHRLDPNLPVKKIIQIDEILESGDSEKCAQIEEALIHDDSPYPEVWAAQIPTNLTANLRKQVRAAVRNYDEDLPANTIRAWTIGLFLTTIGAGINCLFSLRNPSIAISTFAIQLVSFPIGRGWDAVMPNRQYNIRGLKFNLNPGKFNFKEHAIIICMANAAYAGTAIYATDVLISQKVFYGQDFG